MNKVDRVPEVRLTDFFTQIRKVPVPDFLVPRDGLNNILCNKMPLNPYLSWTEIKEGQKIVGKITVWIQRENGRIESDVDAYLVNSDGSVEMYYSAHTQPSNSASVQFHYQKWCYKVDYRGFFLMECRVIKKIDTPTMNTLEIDDPQGILERTEKKETDSS